MTQRREKILLALDTSTSVIGLSLYNGAEVLNETIWHSHFHHTTELSPAVQAALDKSSVTYKELVAIGVALGPGSFTGLRIGLALAKGIALAHHLEVIGVPTLHILAAAQPLDHSTMIAVLRAGRGRFACQKFEAEKKAWQPVGTLEVMTLDELVTGIDTPLFLCGELDAQDRLTIKRSNKNIVLASPARSIRRPSYLAEIAWKRWTSKKVDDPASLAPVYLHYKEPIPG